MSLCSLVALEQNYHPSVGSCHHRRAPGSSGYLDDWHQFCYLAVEEGKHILYQSPEVCVLFLICFHSQMYTYHCTRVNVGGKLNVICFDKTGTLTEDGLDVFGIQVVDENKRFGHLFSDLHSRDSTLPQSLETMLHVMSTCHSLRIVDGEVIGDPLDLKMFQFTNWTYEEGTQATENSDDDDNITPSVARPPPSSSPSAEAVSLNPRNWKFYAYTTNTE